jgi:hypothetical protein
MKRQVDEKTGWWNDKLMKWQVDQIIKFIKCQKVKWEVNEKASLWSNKLMKQQVNEASWWNENLMKEKK